jgi:branched-chain amino acid transport system permease protein
MESINRKSLIGATVVFGLLAAFPPLIGSYGMILMFIILMYVTLAMSYDIMGGHTGYLNFGHCTFFGIGAYAFGILYLHKVPVILAFALPPLIVAAFAACVSYPLFRIRGVYFSLTTVGLTKLVEQLVLNFSSLTEGSAGLSVPTGQNQYLTYYMTLLIASAAVGINYILMRSKFGLALACIREDEDVAESFGIDCYKYKCAALTLSAAIAGCMGTVYMFSFTYLIPSDVFGYEIMFAPAIMAMLGGTGTLMGPIIGAVFITLLQEILWTRLAYLHMATYGIIFAMVGLFMPGGIVREERVWRVFKRIGERFGSSTGLGAKKREHNP